MLDWLVRLPGSLAVSVRPYLRQIQRLDHQLELVPELMSDLIGDADGLLLINARIMPTVDHEKTLNRLCKLDRGGVVLDAEDGSVLAARLTAADLSNVQPDDLSPMMDQLLALSRKQPPIDVPLSALRWPHDVVACHMNEMRSAMNRRLELGAYTETQDGLFVGKNVKIGQYASVDTTDGPIVLEDNVKVGPFCYLSGPAYVGAGTRIIEHSAIKDGVSIGHTCKIGGEVEASVIESYSNKQHHGFLGHSYLGSWINLGAGTCNSDLKNTYGKINVSYGDRKVATGMQFLGCIIGDYSKTAINTSIFTGKVIGVCSMMYGFVTSNVPSYVNYARLFGQTSLLPADVMINTQQRMFARRKVEQRECDKQLIRDMYDLTDDERSADPDIL